MKKIILLVVAFIAFSTAFAQISPDSMVNLMGKGINLGNTLENEGQDSKYLTIREFFFEDYVEAGFTNVRIPVRWHTNMLSTSPYTVDTDWMDKIEGVVDQALDKGLVVILNPISMTISIPFLSFAPRKACK